MIAVAELLQESYIPGDYFSPDAYVQGDFEAGLIENRSGARLIALPSPFLQAIYAGLEDEVGPAAGLVLFSCGRWWGKSFYRRFVDELNKYHNRPVAELDTIDFIQCLKQCWKAHGWGKLSLDLSYHQQGYLIVQTCNSAFSQAAPQSNRPACFAEAGLLSAFFSQLTGQTLHCVQTSCESLGASTNSFILGLQERLIEAETGVEEGESHESILERLCPMVTPTDPSDRST